MKELLTRNVGWKLLALVASVSIWISVSSQPELTAFASAPLEYKAKPPDLEISSEILESVYLELRGPSGILRDFSDSRAAGVIDLATVRQPGERTFGIAESNLPLPRGITLIRAIPSQVRLKFERRTFRNAPVRVRFSLPPGHDIDHYEVRPQYVSIVGPESYVAQVRYALTDSIDLTGAGAVSEFSVNVAAPNAQVRIQNSTQVTVKVWMKKH